MEISKKPYFVETIVSIENIKIRVCVDEGIYAFGEGCVALPHNHSLYEIRYYAQGSGELVIGERHMRIAPGELYVIHPNEYHYQNDLIIESGITQFSIRFTPVHPSDNAPSIQNRAYNGLCNALSYLHHISDSNLELLPYFEKTASEIKERRYGHAGCITALLTCIITEILRRSDINDKKVGMAHTGDFMIETDTFFSSQHAKKVTLKDYADKLNISARQASRVIRKNFGMSFVEKLTETRIEHAKVILIQTNKSLSEIASSCGFQSCGYFITCFKKYTDMTPTQYRNANR